METLQSVLDSGRMTETHIPSSLVHPDGATIRRMIERRGVAALATVSAAGRPHVATVLYQAAGDALFVSTDRHSRKGRNVAACGAVAVVIAVRRVPFGPPSSIQFQTTAQLLSNDDPEIVALAAAGRLDRVTSHGELDRAGGCFLRLALPTRVVTYGLGMSLWRLMRHPLDAAGEVMLPPERP
jgi:hypothetical protein